MECTIVIPTYNRPAHLKRILSYYHQYGSGLPVLIADSSSEKNKKLNRKTVATFYGASFLYFGKYDTHITPYNKIADALQYVFTKYCVLCADDDFIIPDGIREAAAFLDINPDFVAVYGRREVFLIEIGGHMRPKVNYLKYHSHSNTFSQPKDRLIHDVANYDGTSFYAVYNTDLMKMLYSEILKYTDGDLFAELLSIGLSSIYGRMNCLNKLFSVREACTPGQLTQRHTSLGDMMKDYSYIDKAKRFSDCLAGHLSKQTGMDMQKSYYIVDKALSEYARKSSLLSHRINILITDLHLPLWLDNNIRKLYRASSLAFSPSERAYSLTIQYQKESNQITGCILSNARETYEVNY